MGQIQILAIIFSLVLVIYILLIITRKKLKEEYSLLWLGISLVFLIFSAWRQGLEKLADILGIAYPPAALFLLMLVGIILILIQFSVIISNLAERSKIMAQQFGIMKMENARLKKEVAELRGCCKGSDTAAPDLSAGNSDKA